MAHNCKKCGMLKMTDKSNCCCNVKKFDEKKLNKKTKETKKPKPIAKKSEKKKIYEKERGRMDILFQKIAKMKCNEDGKGVCEYCSTPFNIKNLINQLVCFAHILAKGDPIHRHLAMFINNIAFVCSETCHKNMDQEICELKIKPVLQKQIENGETIDVSNLQQYVEE